MVSVASLFLLGYILLVLSSELPPNVLWPIGLGSLLVLYLYLDRMFKYRREGKLKRVGVLAVCMVLTFTVPFSVFEIMTPKWSFTVATDKTVYKLGETVTITMSIANNGRTTHSFNRTNSQIRIVVYLSNSSISLRWIGTAITISESEYSVTAGQSVQRTVAWNQTIVEGGSGQLFPLSTGVYYLRIEVWDMSNVSKPLFSDYVQATIEP